MNLIYLQIRVDFRVGPQSCVGEEGRMDDGL
jgi:hypothetical protein